MYSYCYVYVFLLLCMFCSVYSVLIVPTGILRLFWLRFFHAFSSVLRLMPGYNSQRQSTARTFSNYLFVMFYALFVSVVLFYVLFVYKCVLYVYYCHRVSTQLQLTNISSSYQKHKCKTWGAHLLHYYYQNSYKLHVVSPVTLALWAAGLIHNSMVRTHVLCIAYHQKEFIKNCENNRNNCRHDHVTLVQ
jgi:hypothetical protein